MRRWVQAARRPRPSVLVLMTVVGGLASSLAFEPWGHGWLAPLGVALLVRAVLSTDASRAVALRAAPALGAVHGGVAAGLLLWWLWGSIAPAAWVALAAVHMAWGALLGLGIAVSASLPGQLAWIASMWTAVELARSSWPFGGLPWGRLGHAALDMPWQALLGWVGVTGVSWTTALVGTAAALLGLGRGVRGPVLTLGAVALLVLAVPAATAGALGEQVVRVAVVQPGVPGDGTDLGTHHRQVTDRLVLETRRLAWRAAEERSAQPDLVLWPENATAVDPFDDSAARAAIREAVGASGAPVVAGSVLEGPRAGTLANTAVAWRSDEAGGVAATGRYVKQNLVPFGEYVPLRAVAERVSSRVAEVRSDMVPGDQAEPLTVSGVRLAMALCFDVAYRDPLAAQVRQGADLVTVQTSNATFNGTSQPEQQWAISRVRAVELGRAVVVSSTTGVSGAVGPDGSVLARLASGGPSSTVVEVPVATALTPAVRLGPWPDRLAVLLSIACLVAFVTRAHTSSPRVATLRLARRRLKTPPVCEAALALPRCPGLVTTDRSSDGGRSWLA